MKNTLLFMLLIAAILCCLLVPAAARGGRGRGGGSVGGLFGGWRKYKKPSSSGGGRRVVNGSPVHTSMPVPKPPPPPPAAPAKASYPRQQLPPGYGYSAMSGAGHAPAGSTYYANAQALPAGAVYYAQPPMSSSVNYGQLLTGMLAGHILRDMFRGHGHHVYHNAPDMTQAQPNQANGREIIIINNGVGTDQLPATDVPLNESLSSNEAATGEDSDSQQLQSAEATATLPPAGGIICFPIMLNETDPNNPELVHQVERVVCFPAPSQEQLQHMNCPMRTYIEADPNDASRAIEVQRPDCTHQSTTEPPIVAGDIGAGVAPIEVASFVADRH